GREQGLAVEDAGLQPGPELSGNGRAGAHLVEQRLVVDAVEALRDVGVEDVLGLPPDRDVDGLDRIPTRPPGAEAVAVRLDPPPRPGVAGPRARGPHRRSRERRVPRGAASPPPGLGNGAPPHGRRLPVQPERRGQPRTTLRRDELDPVHPGGLLAHVVLCDPTDRDQPGCLPGQQELLELAYTRYITTHRGSVDPRLESEQLTLQGEPGESVPAIVYRHGVDPVGGPTFQTTVPTSAYPRAFPGALASWAIPPPCGIRLAPAPANRESTHGVTSFLPLVVVPDVGPDSPPGDVWDARPGRYSPRPRSPFPFGSSPLTRVGLSAVTTAASVRVPARVRPR